MMEKYIEFNAVKFLKDSKTWEGEKQRLQAKLDGITEIKGIDNSPIRSGRLHDSVADVAAEREQIEEDIARIEKYQEAFKYVKRFLTQEQLDVIDVFFFQAGNMGKNVRKLAHDIGVRERGIYEVRREAVNTVQKIITEKFL